MNLFLKKTNVDATLIDWLFDWLYTFFNPFKKIQSYKDGIIAGEGLQ